MTERIFTIVAADDDLDDQELIKRAFRDAKVKVNVLTVNDGIQLLDLLLGRYRFSSGLVKPDVIFLDLNMPLMDGFQALIEIRRHHALRDIPVYVVTTSKSPHDEAKALELGANGFYHKGASSKEIKRIAHEVCSECFV